MTRITALMTVHNRRTKTEACLRSLLSQDVADAGFSVHVVVVDDGSTDGTATMLADLEPNGRLTILAGTGNLFWAAGMALAQREAVTHNPDFLLWLNDDVVLDDDAIPRALKAARSAPGAILVGATHATNNPEAITYSASTLSGRRPGSLRRVQPATTTQAVHAFNGNFVLVPRSAYETVGLVDGRFAHGYGDIDYGLRAKRKNIPMFLMSGTIGACDSNPTEGSWRDRRTTRRERLAGLIGRKGYPIRSHYRFNVRHAGAAGIAFATLSYARQITLIILKKDS